MSLEVLLMLNTSFLQEKSFEEVVMFKLNSISLACNDFALLNKYIV